MIKSSQFGFWMIATVTTCFATEVNAGNSWVVWKHNTTRPGQVAVAPTGSLGPPWKVDSVWHSNTKGAWKKVCWLVRNGDIVGRRYSSRDMNAGRVSCDANCNCRF